MRTSKFNNRELSWLDFNERVLNEALREENPLLERLKFLAIVSSNLDEFFMVRVAALKAQVREGRHTQDLSGLSPTEQLSAISTRVRELCKIQYQCFSSLILVLQKEGLYLTSSTNWTEEETAWLDEYFTRDIFPLLTPLRFLAENEESSLMVAGNLRVHCGFLLQTDSIKNEKIPIEKARKLAIVQVPPNVERFIRLPSTARNSITFALLEDVVTMFGVRLFSGYLPCDTVVFKITRDADFPVDEDREEDFLTAMEEVLADRQISFPIRLSYSQSSKGGGQDIIKRLQLQLGLKDEDTYPLPGPIDLKAFFDFAKPSTIPSELDTKLRYKPWTPISSLEPDEDLDIWEEMLHGDKILHVPYESFDPIIRFLDTAADDPAVLAIKIILYRTSGNSPIVHALERAARRGKQVAVLLELKARFDEERNMEWAEALEKAGAIVIYGIARLKVHAKAAMVIRRESNNTIKRYLHMATGNYNDKTLYQDLSLFTADEELCREVSIFFNMVTGYSAVQKMRHISVAPFDLKTRLISLIQRETERSTVESPGFIMAKMNSLADKDIIFALYRASQAGVKILLNIRGICALVPGIKNQSENICVISVVGRYLEHSRIIYFANGGNDELFLSSADWMPRNLEKRIELLFPIRDEDAKKRILNILNAYFIDTHGSYRLQPDGKWKKVLPPKNFSQVGQASSLDIKPFSAQESFYENAKQMRAYKDKPRELLQVRRSIISTKEEINK